MSRYFDRQGRPIDLMGWAKKFEDADYKVIAKTKIDKPIKCEVSTVWLGMNHQWGDGPPLIFETMVFQETIDKENPQSIWDQYQRRYSIEEEALAGHEEIVNAIKEDK